MNTSHLSAEGLFHDLQVSMRLMVFGCIGSVVGAKDLCYRTSILSDIEVVETRNFEERASLDYLEVLRIVTRLVL